MKQKLDVVKVKIQLIHEARLHWHEDGDEELSHFKTLNYIFERETGHIFSNTNRKWTSNAPSSKANYHTIGNLMPKMLAKLELDGNGEIITQKIEIMNKGFAVEWYEDNKMPHYVELENYQITIYFDDEIHEVHKFIPMILSLKYDTVEIDVKEEGE